MVPFHATIHEIKPGDSIVFIADNGLSYANISSIGEESEENDVGSVILHGKFWGPACGDKWSHRDYTICATAKIIVIKRK